MSSSSRRVWLSTCSAPSGCGGAPGSVTSTRSSIELRGQLRSGELDRARLDQRLERLAGLVGRPADGCPLIGRQRGDLAQQLRQLGAAAEEAHPQLLERGRVGGGGDRGLRLAAQLCDPIGHDAGTLDGSRVVS